MRRKKTMAISEVLSEYKRVMQIEDKLKEVEIVNLWEKIAGKAIAGRTSKVYIKSNTLHISTSSPVVRNELLMMKDIIKTRVNEIAGYELVQNIDLH
ncbi:MAG: DUF721 domain-containing protein [Marinilabiliaceae bacterium]|jgi:hypothetical protein|nr:DUF721 domain-containing protein [Marinilabiliaceae bacterium]